MLRIKNRQRGFSLIEVLISLTVIGVGLLGLSGLQIASIKTTNNAHSLNVSTMLAMELSDRMRANPVGVTGGFYENDVNCSRFENQCRTSNFCTPEEIARLDIQELKCGVLKNGIREGGVANLLVGADLIVDHNVDCNTSFTNADETTITIDWNSSNIDQSQDASDQNQSLTICTIP